MKIIHRRSLIVLVASLIIAATSTFVHDAARAQSQSDVICYDWHSINPDSRAAVQGTITDAEYAQQWRFVGRTDTGVQIRLEVLGGSLDPFVYVTDETTGQRVVSGSINIMDGRQIVQMTFIPPSDGAYTITATRAGERSGNSGGAYRLTLEQISSRRVTGGEYERHSWIYDGEIVQGHVSSQDRSEVWYFSGTLGQTINVRLRGVDGFELQNDAHVLRVWYLYENRAWSAITQNYSVNSNQTILTNVVLADSTQFALVVEGNYSAISAYELFLSGAGGVRPDPLACGDPLPQCPTPNPLDASAVSVLNNVPQTGSVGGAAPIIAYQFAALQGNSVSIDMRRLSGDLDTYLGLLDGAGGVLAFDDSTDPGLSNISNFIIPANGCYTIYASREGVFDGTTEGAFTLTVTGIPQEAPDIVPFPSDVIAGGDIRRGETGNGTITASDPRVAFRFVGDGGAVTVSAARASGTLRPALQLLDQDYNLLSEVGVTFAGNASNPLTFTADDGATYFIVVQRLGGADGNTDGDFSVTVGS